MELVSIGRFSRICWLSIKALRLYDEHGLLPRHTSIPATAIASTSRLRPPWLGRSRLLRSLDMPLADIKDLLTESDANKIHARLEEHRRTLSIRLEEHQRMLRRVEQLMRRGPLMSYEFEIKEYEPVEVARLGFHTSPDDIGADATTAFRQLFGALFGADVDITNPSRLVYHDMQGDDWRVEASVPVASGTVPPKGLETREFPGCRAATTVHVGPYDELGIAWEELCKWISANGHTGVGEWFDVYLNDPNKVADLQSCEQSWSGRSPSRSSA
jgi:effector-binding domain-containing protein